MHYIQTQMLEQGLSAEIQNSHAAVLTERRETGERRVRASTEEILRL